MNFDKAYTELMAGKRIRRKEWTRYTHMRLVEGKIKTFQTETNSFYTDAQHLFANDWTVIDGDGKKITFVEAVEELKQKKGIRHEGMELDSFIFIDNNNHFAICKAVEFQFMPTFKCLCSNDWEVLK